MSFEENPWAVSTLKHFNYLCCPECTFKAKKVATFQDHALSNHPKAETFFGKEWKVEDDNDDYFDDNNYDNGYDNDDQTGKQH